MPYDRVWEDEPAEGSPPADKSPVTRTLDKKEVEDEVVEALNPRDYTMRNALERMERLGADPMSPVLTETPDLSGALARLAGLLSS